MIELLSVQADSTVAFRSWAEAMIGEATLRDDGWLHEGSALLFTNYGHGVPGTVDDQVMLGVDPATGDGTVKIVEPDAAMGDRGRLTAAGRDADGRLILLRQGWLKRNNVSREVRADFAALSGLAPVQVRVGDALSTREWFVVADLAADPAGIARQTAGFTLACVRARTRAGGGRAVPIESRPYSLGLDEKGRVVVVHRRGGMAKVRALQGYVFEALRELVGDGLTKPVANGYAVDGLVEAANMLVEIKTGAFAHHCYEAVGQLALYPSLIGIDRAVDRVLLLPDSPALRPIMAAALRDAGVEVHTYSVRGAGRHPRISFSPAFRARAAQGRPARR